MTAYMLRSLLLAVLLVSGGFAADQVTRPQVGMVAPAATMTTVDGNPLPLTALTASGPVVVVVLRGWPGYQCPLCTRQVSDFTANAATFAALKTRVILVYPGPAERLGEHAKEFLARSKKELPAPLQLVLDPDYAVVNAFGLRWEAAKETAYPSTFVIGSDGIVRFAYISTGHGDRTTAKTILTALGNLPAQP